MEEILRLDLNLGPWMRGEDLRVEDFWTVTQWIKACSLVQERDRWSQGGLILNHSIESALDGGDGVDQRSWGGATTTLGSRLI